MVDSLFRNMLMLQLLFMQRDLDKARNLEVFLTYLKQMSGLKINFRKSKLFYLEKPTRHRPVTLTCLVARRYVSNVSIIVDGSMLLSCQTLDVLYA